MGVAFRALQRRLRHRSTIPDVLWDALFESRARLQDSGKAGEPEHLAAARSTNTFISESMKEARAFEDRWALLDHALRTAPEDGDVLEFGVNKGSSLRFIAGGLDQGRRIYGFDSFEGLPTDWVQGSEAVPAGTFRVRSLPQVPPNVTLVRGWFDSTLPRFLQTHPVVPAFVHIDSDLYSSASTVLDLLGPKVRGGTVLVFDEFFGYPGWEAGEARALAEARSKFNWEVKFLGYVRDKVSLVISQVSDRPNGEARPTAAPGRWI